MTDDAAIAELDFARYTRVPMLDVAHTITLGQQLLTAAPKRPPAGVKNAAKRLRTQVDQFQEQWTRQTLVERADGRPIDGRADAAWAAAALCAEGAATLPAEHYPVAGKAARILALLFPN